MSTSYGDISGPLITGICTTLSLMSVPVYKSVPKTPEDAYVLVSGVIQTEDGTKDDFVYRGTVQVRVVTDNQQTADKKAAQTLLSSVRSFLQPQKGFVFGVNPYTLISFTPESMTELTEQTENGIKISLIDIYNFILE